MFIVPHFEHASAAPITVPKPSFASAPLYSSTEHRIHKEEDLSYSLGSIALKDSYDSPRGLDALPSSPHSGHSYEQGSFESHPRGFFSEPSSCAQSPTPQRFSGSELSTSLGNSPTPSRPADAAFSWDCTENYWTSRTRESRMSVYSPMHSLGSPNPMLAPTTLPSTSTTCPISPTLVALLSTDNQDPQELEGASSFDSTSILRSSSTPLMPSPADPINKKELRKSIKRDKLQAKAIKKRQKSIAKLQKELSWLEAKQPTPAPSPPPTAVATPSTSSSSTATTDSLDAPRTKRTLQSSQSLKMSKSKPRLSASVPENPISPLENAAPKLQTRTTPRKLARAHTWRPATPTGVFHIRTPSTDPIEDDKAVEAETIAKQDEELSPEV